VKVRAAFRLLRLAAHVCRGAMTVACIYPRCDEQRRLLVKQQWSAKLLKILGIALTSSGDTPSAGLLVSNHISFIDVFAINAILPSSFVAKDEVHSWPLFGWLARHADTLFLQRGSRGAAQRARENMVEYLLSGKRVAVFPEGTTSLGDSVLPFHSAMFQAAIDTRVDVIPIAIVYTGSNGERSYNAAFAGEITLMQCLWSIACAQNVTVAVSVLGVHKIGDSDRRHLSAHVHHTISQHISGRVSRPV
jgi:1-acyl-sn-glycerol-3-phosphate acyltransferase